MGSWLEDIVGQSVVGWDGMGWDGFMGVVWQGERACSVGLKRDADGSGS